jgi:Zn-dependent protease with chaperone function
MGSGFVVTTAVMVDDLNDDELGVVVRHELSHYRHAEARWAPLQTIAGFAPVLTIAFGEFLNRFWGRYFTVALYVLGLLLHVLAFKTKRFFEARADRESVRNQVEARAAQSALLKFGTLKQRHQQHSTQAEADRLIAEFAMSVNGPQSRSDRIFNAIWGVHPPLAQRLARYEKYSQNRSYSSIHENGRS